MNVLKFGLIMGLAAPLWAELPLLQCPRDRYYEGEKIICLIRQNPGEAQKPRTALLIWNILGKDLKKEEKVIPWPEKTASTTELVAPTGLRAVVPLRVEAQFIDPTDDEDRRGTVIHLFPRDPKYWVDENEFKGKTILVDSSIPWICSELDALHVPYTVDHGRELLSLKRVDLRLNASMFNGFDRRDPWSRWNLVELIRKQLEAENGAKQ